MTPEDELRALTRLLEWPEEMRSRLTRRISDPGGESESAGEGRWMAGGESGRDDHAARGDRGAGAGGWLMAGPEGPAGSGRGGAPRRLWCAGDRNGTVHLLAAWEGGRLRGALLRLPGREWLEIRPGSGHHPLFGECDELFHHSRSHLTRSPPSGAALETSARSVGLFPAQDYSRPRTIPPLDRPGALPPGAGSAVLNFLALLMKLGGVKAARYRGPYPTPALFSTLKRSFNPPAEGGPAEELFSRRESELAFRGEMALNPLDWEPAPHSLFLPHPRVLVQWRNGVEGAWVDRTPFRISAGAEPSGAGGARVWREGAGGAGTCDGERYGVGLVLMGRPWRRFCRLDRWGNLLEQALPDPSGRMDGPERAALHPLWKPVVTGWAVLQSHPVLAPSVLAVGNRCPFRWASLPLSLARGTDQGVEIQAGLPEQFRRRREREEPAALAMMLVSDVLEAAAPPLKQAAQRELERLAGPSPEERFREGERLQAEARRTMEEHLPILVDAILRGEALPDEPG